MKLIAKNKLFVCLICAFFFFGAAFLWRPDLLFSTLNEESIVDIEKIKPQASENSFCFAYASDCRENMEVLSKIVKSINNDSQIQWFVFGGDIVFNQDLYEYRRFIDETAKKLKIPMVVIPGNHEMKGIGKIWFRYLFGRPFFTFQVGPDRYICLDNSNTKSFGNPQILWLKRVLAKSQNNRFRFAFFHVPLYGEGAGVHGDNMNGKNPTEVRKVNDIMIGGRVSRAFSSHQHGYFKGSWNGVPYTISAGAGSPFHEAIGESSFYHYIKVKITKNEYSIEVVHI